MFQKVTVYNKVRALLLFIIVHFWLKPESITRDRIMSYYIIDILCSLLSRADESSFDNNS